MFKILFNHKGKQFLEDYGDGGSVTPDAEVLWHEKNEGPFPLEQNTVGAITVLLDGQGKKTLTVDQIKLAEIEAARLAAEAAAIKKIQDKINAIEALKKFDKALFKDKDTADVFENILIAMGIK